MHWANREYVCVHMLSHVCTNTDTIFQRSLSHTVEGRTHIHTQSLSPLSPLSPRQRYIQYVHTTVHRVSKTNWHATRTPVSMAIFTILPLSHLHTGLTASNNLVSPSLTHYESTKVQNPRRNSYTPCVVSHVFLDAGSGCRQFHCQHTHYTTDVCSVYYAYAYNIRSMRIS